LPHVLNHCKPHLAAITRRHNAILDRLAKAYKPPPQTTVRLNQAMPGFDDGLRQDLVITNNTEKWVTIIDVASRSRIVTPPSKPFGTKKRPSTTTLPDNYGRTALRCTLTRSLWVRWAVGTKQMNGSSCTSNLARTTAGSCDGSCVRTRSNGAGTST
jgi:hypothetical protein